VDSTDREQKPYRHRGIPISHGDLYVEHLRGLHHGHVPQRDLDDDEMASCPGLMVHYGDVVYRKDGTRLVEWDGDVWHHEIACVVCDWRTTVETDFKRDYIAQRGEKKTKKKGVQMGPPDDGEEPF
jgi:hypothetical protein